MRRHDCVFRLADVIASSKAAICRRTPKYRNQKFAVVFFPLATMLLIMKREVSDCTLDVGRWTLILFCLSVAAVPAPALTADNPYNGIVQRNAFALKPPTPPTVAAPPTPPPSNVELRGITTLLGRPQVLLNFKIPGKPPELPKDRSMVMDIEQREGEVVVLDINPGNGSVRLRNQGTELTLTLKDNAAKPQSVPSLIAPPMTQPPGVNPVPAPSAIPAPATTGGGSSVSTIGGGAGAMPTRSLRANTPAASAGTATPQAQKVRELTAEEGAALLEVNRKLNEGKGLPYPPPRSGVAE